MKILVFTDVHGDPKIIKKLIELSKKVDLMICCGDITYFSHKLDKILSIFNKTKKKLLIIPGNHESEQDIEKADKKYKYIININKKSYSINGLLFLGYGAGCFSIDDKEFENTTKKFKKLIKKDSKIILVTHAPIYNTKTDYLPWWTGKNKHRGNKSIRKFIEKYQPKFAFCGHFHENLGKKDKIKNTYVVNPGYGKIIVI